MVSRPDIALPVQVLGRSLRASGPEHIRAAKHVIRYLVASKDLGLRFGERQQEDLLVGYCDSDWAGDLETRRSTTAYVFMIAGGAVTWASRLQATTALSTTEAEYMSACAATQEAIHLRQLLKDIGFEQRKATTLHEDNQGCVALSRNPGDHQRTKHIDIRYHFVREKTASDEIKLVYVPTDKQLADLLTKPLDRIKVERLRQEVLGHGHK
jgi:hypothetical protein